MPKVEFKVFGKIIGKQRPRATIIGGHARIYAPKETVNYESLVKFSFLEKYPNHIPYDNESALKVHIQAFKQMPKAFSKKKVQQALNGELRPKTKPDLDNIAKAVLDGLNQVAYADDKCVVDLHIEQYYSQTEFLIIEIEKISQ